MNRKSSAVAMFTLALGAVGVAATDASAREAPDPQYGNTSPRPNYPRYDPQHHGNMSTSEVYYPAYNYPEYKLDVPTLPTGPTQGSAGLPPEPGSGYATMPDCHWAYHSVCEEVPVPVAPTEAALDPGPSDDTRVEVLQAGASALGGAGLAFGGMWLYRRRQTAI